MGLSWLAVFFLLFFLMCMCYLSIHHIYAFCVWLGISAASCDAKPRSLMNSRAVFKGAAAYQLGNTSSRTITEVKQR